MNTWMLYWFELLETKRVSLEEMDILFSGTSSVTSADAERMAEINREIGLDTLLNLRDNASNSSSDHVNEKSEKNAAIISHAE